MEKLKKQLAQQLNKEFVVSETTISPRILSRLKKHLLSEQNGIRFDFMDAQGWTPSEQQAIRKRVAFSMTGGRYTLELETQPLLKSIFHKIKKQYEHYDFNSVQVNVYENGSKYIAWHSDNNPAYPEDKGIVLLSLGSTRKMGLRSLKNKTLKKSIVLKDRFVLEMKPFCQNKFEHKIEKSNSKQPRISLVFRNLQEHLAR